MRWAAFLITLFPLMGCHAYYADVDTLIARRAADAIDMKLPAAEEPEPKKPESLPKVIEKTPGNATLGNPAAGDRLTLVARVGARQVADQGTPPATMMDRLQFKEGILGIKVADLKMPPLKATDEERKKAIEAQFPPMPRVPELPPAGPGPEGNPLTLADLQQIAMRSSPLIRQAHQEVQTARGLALQAGLYPNPVIGFDGNSIGQGNGDGQRSKGILGGFAEQTIITAGKLTLARSAALQEVQIAEQKLKQVEADVQAQVRTQYFNVLSARENHRVMKGLTELTDELYNVLVLQMRAGEVAGYEPMQIRVLAMQARTSLVQAHNRYVTAWKQLAAALGTPGMPLTALAGRIDMPVPHFDHDAVLAYVLANHTDVLAANFGVEKARLLARLAEVQPIPDVAVALTLQKDYTTPPYGQIGNVVVGVPVPLWNRNQGNIQAARSQTQRALAEQDRVHNELTASVAEAFQRYENNRTMLAMYKETMLPNQVQAFRAAVARHAALGDKNVSYNDIVTVQQALANLITNYLTLLNDQWAAVVDIGHLTQTRDLFQARPADEVAPVPDLRELRLPPADGRRE